MITSFSKLSSSFSSWCFFQAGLNLQPRSSACWKAQLLSAFQGLHGRELHVRAVQTGRAIPMQEFTANLKHRMRGVWRDAELVYPNALTRTITNWPLIILGLPPLFLESCHAKSVAWTNRVIFPGFIM
jgi:hypothetical protein